MEYRKKQQLLLARHLRKHKRIRQQAGILALLGALVFGITAYVFILPAITLDTAEDSLLYLSREVQLELYEASAQADTVELVLKSDERIALKTSSLLLGDWQWEIYSPGDEKWISIYQENQSSCLVYPAMLSAMADVQGYASVRLRVLLDNQEYISSCARMYLEPAEPMLEAGTYALKDQDFSDTAVQEAQDSAYSEETSPQQESPESHEESSQTEEEGLPAKEIQDPEDPEEEKDPDPANEEEEPAMETALSSLGSFGLFSQSQQTCTVTVRYVFTDGRTAKDSWVGTYSFGYLTQGQTIVIPEIEGYTATLNEQEMAWIELPDAIEQDLEYTIVYKPASVSYTVEFWQQNVQDSQYTLYETRTYTGLTDTVVPDPQVSYPGFSMRSWKQPAIAADGSTLVRIEYDRNYYKTLFELDGGIGDGDFYGQYGQTLQIETPTKAGYVFEGWYADAECTVPVQIPSTVLDRDMVFYAGWSASQTTYSVLIWYDQSSTSEYVYSGQLPIQKGQTGQEVTYQQVSELVEDYLESSQMTEYFSIDEQRSRPVTLKGDGSSSLNVYLKRNTYGLRFVYARSDARGRWSIPTGNTSWSFKYQKGQEESALSGGVSWTSVSGEVSFTEAFSNKMDSCNLDEDLEGQGLEAGSFASGNYTYYYVDLYSRWDEDISELWPSLPFENAGSYSFISWGVFSQQPYFSSDAYLQSSNPNIKGIYGMMDSIMVPAGSQALSALMALDETGSQTCQMFVGYWNARSVNNYTYEIYAEALSSDLQEDLVYYDGNGKAGYQGTAGYYSLVKSIEVLSTDTINGQTILNFTGLDNSNVGVVTDAQSGTIRFYYQRTRYTLSLFNGYDSTMEIQIPYGESLKDYPVSQYVLVSSSGDRTTVNVPIESQTALSELEPVYPGALTEGAWQFSGQWYWYAQSPEEDTEIYHPDLLYSFENKVMEAQNIMLAGKWETALITLNFWRDESREVSLAASQVIEWNTLAYDPYASSDPAYPVWSNKRFKGWYILISGTEPQLDDQGNVVTDTQGNVVYKTIRQNISFATTTFRQDTDIYALWDEDFDMEYVIHYVTLDAMGNAVSIADDTFGTAKASSTVTEYPKTGNSLYEGYRTHYFPDRESSSLLMEPESGSQIVEFTFVYTRADAVPYTVRYLKALQDEEGNILRDENGEIQAESALLESETVYDNVQAVVTQTYKPVEGYVPAEGQYQITKILTYSPGQELLDNVITFYYVKAEESVPYTVNHYIQNVDGTYSIQDTFKAYGEAGTEVSAIESQYDGYLFNSDHEESKTQGVLVMGSSLSLNLFYDAMPVTLIKSWNSTQAQTVTFDIYKTDQQNNGVLLEEACCISISEEENWQKTIYVPWPMGSDSYALVESSTGNWKADYLPAQTIFVNGQELKAALLEWDEEAGMCQVLIKNSQVFALPSTGGTSVLFVSGASLAGASLAALAGLAVFCLQQDRKRRAAALYSGAAGRIKRPKRKERKGIS